MWSGRVAMILALHARSDYNITVQIPELKVSGRRRRRWVLGVTICRQQLIYGGSKTDGRGGCIYILNWYLYTGKVVKTYRDVAHISGFSGSARTAEKPESFIFPEPCRRAGRIYVSLGWELIIRITIGVRRSDVYK